MVYVYPKFPAIINLGVARFSGSGLSNCLFVYARAVAISHRYNIPIIKPAWLNVVIGPYLRGESDKRHYLGLFNSNGEISGLKKAFILSTYRHIKENEAFDKGDNLVIDVKGLGDYFLSIIPYHETIASYILSHIIESNLAKVNAFDFTNCVAVHVRLGDYVPERRVPISWYIERINELREQDSNFIFLLFSDGKENELKEILAVQNVKKVFFGNAIADIVAISRCKCLIGSDSTFSAWGAFLGQIPCRYKRLKSKPVLVDCTNEIVEEK